MKRFCPAVLLATIAITSTATPLFASAFGLCYNRCGCGKCCSFCVRPWNAFSAPCCGQPDCGAGCCFGYGGPWKTKHDCAPKRSICCNSCNACQCKKRKGCAACEGGMVEGGMVEDGVMEGEGVDGGETDGGIMNFYGAPPAAPPPAPAATPEPPAAGPRVSVTPAGYTNYYPTQAWQGNPYGYGYYPMGYAPAPAWGNYPAAGYQNPWGYYPAPAYYPAGYYPGPMNYGYPMGR